MAMDNFKEEIVVARHMGLLGLAYYMLWAVMIVCAVIGLMMVNIVMTTIAEGFSWTSLIIALVFVAIAVLIWFKKDNLRVEYEYTFTNGILDVSKVLNNSKRKYLAEITLKTVESAGSVKCPAFNRFVNDRNIKKHNWFLNRDNDLIYIYFTKNSVRHLAVIEPTQEMQELIRSKGYMNFGVWQG